MDIRWVNLEPARGAETKKERPCVVLQDNLVNPRSRTAIVAPILPDHKTWPFAINITPSKANGLDIDRHINVKQLRAIDVSRISQPVGKIEVDYLDEIHEALSLVFGLS